MIDYDDKKEIISFRHYRIILNATKLHKQVKKVLNLNKMPDFSKYNDISEYIKKGL